MYGGRPCAEMSSTDPLRYRRDLRVHDPPALVRALREAARVVPVFVLDDALLHGRFAPGSARGGGAGAAKHLARRAVREC